MLEELYEKLKKHRVRFYPYQKKRFRDLIEHEFAELGYDDVVVDKAKNVIIGDVHNARIIYTAHYDTPMFSPWFLFARVFGHVLGGLVIGTLLMLLAVGVVTVMIAGFLEGLVTGEFFMFADSSYFWISSVIAFALFFIFPSPGNANDNTSGVLAVYEIASRLKAYKMEEGIAFVLFNNEEWGLIGSGAFKKEMQGRERIARRNGDEVHKFTLINFDCVGIGDRIMLGYASANGKRICQGIAPSFRYPVDIKKGNIMTSGSDHLHFKDNGIGIFVSRRSYLGPLHLPMVHNPFNKKIDINIVKDVCDAILNVGIRVNDE